MDRATQKRPSTEDNVMPAQENAVEIRGLTKNYGGVLALRGVEFTLNSGEVNA